MQNETHYYLLNGKVKKGGEMPQKPCYKVIWDEEGDETWNDWKDSLQPCEIDERELIKIRAEIADLLTDYPIDITDIVEEKPFCNADCPDVDFGNCDHPSYCIKVNKIYFKQPTEKQFDIHKLKDYKSQLHEKCDNQCFYSCSKGSSIAPECLQPKQVESECEAVEFCNWVNSNGWKRHTPNSKGWNYIQFIFDESVIKSDLELYEIFKNR